MLKLEFGLLALPLFAPIVTQVSLNRQSKKDDDHNHARCSDFIERRHVIQRHIEIEVPSKSNFNTRETLLASATIPYLFALLLGIPVGL